MKTMWCLTCKWNMCKQTCFVMIRCGWPVWSQRGYNYFHSPVTSFKDLTSVHLSMHLLTEKCPQSYKTIQTCLLHPVQQIWRMSTQVVDMHAERPLPSFSASIFSDICTCESERAQWAVAEQSALTSEEGRWRICVFDDVMVVVSTGLVVTWHIQTLQDFCSRRCLDSTSVRLCWYESSSVYLQSARHHSATSSLTAVNLS